MNRILLIFTGLALAFGITIPLFIGLLSPAYIGPELQRLVTRESGLRLQLSEAAELSFLPQLEIRLANAQILDADGQIIAELPQITLNPSWYEILNGEIGKTRISLLDPQFTLRIAKDGAAGFAFGNKAAEGFELPILIVNGRLQFEDARSDDKFIIEQIDGELTARDGLAFMGGVNMGKQRLNLTAYVQTMARLVGAGSPADISVRSGQMHFTFSGLAQLAEGLKLVGQAEMEMADIGEFAHIYGVKMPMTAPAIRISASGGFEANRQSIGFRNGNFKIQGNPARGDIFIKPNADALELDARLGFDRLELESFIGLTETSGLKGQIAIAARQLHMQQFTSGQAMMTAQLAEKSLELFFKSVSLGPGSAQGSFKINTAKPTHKIGLELSLKDADAQQSLGFIFGTQGVTGLIDMQLYAVSEGKSAEELLAKLVGSGKISMRSAKLPDIDIHGLIKAVSQKVLQGWAPVADVFTPVISLKASFNLADGVASAKDFSLRNDDITLSGQMNVDFLRQFLQMRLNAEAANGEKLLPVALLGEGNFTNPKFYPDMPGVLANPQRAYQAMNAMTGGGNEP